MHPVTTQNESESLNCCWLSRIQLSHQILIPRQSVTKFGVDRCASSCVLHDRNILKCIRYEVKTLNTGDPSNTVKPRRNTPERFSFRILQSNSDMCRSAMKTITILLRYMIKAVSLFCPELHKCGVQCLTAIFKSKMTCNFRNLL